MNIRINEHIKRIAMKKGAMLLLLFFAVIVLTVYSQTNSSKIISTPENTTYIYCELVRHDLYLPGVRTSIFIDFGTKSTYQNKIEERNYVKLQKDGVDALNYMGGNGWELVTKNLRETSGGGIENVYVLRKKVL